MPSLVSELWSEPVGCISIRMARPSIQATCPATKNEGISRINSQRDVDAYNATVSAESDMLVCTREQVLGSNIREFVCLTVAQRERLRQAAVEDLEFLNQELNRTGSAAGPE